MRPGHWVAIDGMIAALLTAVGLWSAEHDALGYLVVVSMTVPVAARRIWPVPVFGVVLFFSALAPQFGVLRDADLARAMAVYPILLLMTEWIAAGAAVVVVATTVLANLAAFRFDLEAGAGPAFSGGLTMVTACAIGIAVRLHRRYLAGQREQAAERAVTRERLHIARELHDVLAHGISVITIQAGVARHVFEMRPQEALRALTAIEDTSRSSLAELRQMLTALRTDDDHGGDGDGSDGPELDPMPSLADLGTLAERTTAAGAPVDVQVRGDQRALPPGLELSAYRIVQEALTNVVKHAGPARAEVVLHYLPEALTIEVTDDGHGGDGGHGARVTGRPPGPGRPTITGRPSGAEHGILGMRERVAVFGGHLSAGPLPPPESGFRVWARLPLTDAAP